MSNSISHPNRKDKAECDHCSCDVLIDDLCWIGGSEYVCPECFENEYNGVGYTDE